MLAVPASHDALAADDRPHLRDPLPAQPLDVLVVIDERSVEAVLDRAVGPFRPGGLERVRRDARDALKAASLARLAALGIEMRRAYPQLPMMALRPRSWAPAAPWS